MDHCTLSVHDSTNDNMLQFSVKPPYATTLEELHVPDASQEASPTEAFTMEGTDQKPKSMNRVESTLLHKRLGHTSIPALANASHHEVWEDTKLSFGHDKYCEDCKISFPAKLKEEKPSRQKLSK